MTAAPPLYCPGLACAFGRNREPSMIRANEKFVPTCAESCCSVKSRHESDGPPAIRR
ncbi:hypothetical protein D3C83_68160 [compost metagenome]